jgi:hypothetical protein
MVFATIHFNKFKIKKMNRLFNYLGRLKVVFDVLFFPLTFISALWFKIVRFWGLNKMPLTEKTLMKIGVFPLTDNYYDPFINPSVEKITPYKTHGIDFNHTVQLSLISSFNFQSELSIIATRKKNKENYYYNNNTFNSGDSDFLYSIIRKNKPKNIIEVGCGFSTLMILDAIKENKLEDPHYTCNLVCIEPYENVWLEKLPITLIRKKIQDVPIELFNCLKKNDILFIDSSHVVKLNGDVLHEVFEILPILQSGVWIHFHDIFIPGNYPEDWIKQYRNWTEQYLIQAFLTHNSSYSIKACLHYLYTHHYNDLLLAFPEIKDRQACGPNSLWIEKA